MWRYKILRLKEIIFFLLLLSNCISQQVEEVKFYPSPGIGCSHYSGKDRIKCINELLKELEEIHNTPPKIEIISKTRKNDDIVIIKKRYSHGSRISWESESEVIDRSLIGEVKYVTLIVLPSVIFGFVFGLSI